MFRSTPATSTAPLERDPTGAQREPAPARRRSASAYRAWVFTFDSAHGALSRWFWLRSGDRNAEPRRAFASFDACLADARRHGFDFAQPYHVIAASAS
jgi:hypothetical protein